MIYTSEIHIQTTGENDLVDITARAQEAIGNSGLSGGLACLFVLGSTAGITTVEFEPGLVQHDLPRLFEQIAPRNAHYEHEATWNDDNGHSHVRAGLLGPSVTVPFIEGRLTLGTWQQIVLCEFDTRPRDRIVIAQVVGE